LVNCGDPSDPTVAAIWNPATTENGWFAAPDSATVDSRGAVWVATDQGSNWVETGTADGVWALQTEGDQRGTGRMFLRAPVGAEVCGPRFTPDETTLFVSIQHPGTDGTEHYAGFGRRSSFDDPATRWPDFETHIPPRPSVLAITKRDKGRIGS
jgi:secreted PhoX family phosphatase